jgi:rod shape-determining protein MreD
MKYIHWALAIFFSLIIQSKLSILGVAPNLTALLAYYAGVRYGETRGLLVGALVGILEDSVSSSLIGPNMLSKGAIGYFASYAVYGGVFRWTPILGIIALSLLTFIDSSIVFLSRSLFDVMPAAISTYLFITLMQSLLNAPAGIFIKPEYAD